jgi:hypothetical protein
MSGLTFVQVYVKSIFVLRILEQTFSQINLVVVLKTSKASKR